MKILKTKDIVERLLRTMPHVRDDDNRLLSNVWYRHLKNKGINIHGLSTYHLLTKLAKGELPNQESVRRMRQKLQEVNPDLRGEKYNERHAEEVVVKEDLRTVTKTSTYE